MVSRFANRLSTKLRRAPTKYKLLARIAVGGMAEVWRAEAVFETGGFHLVAVKRILPELSLQPIYRSMFEDEARLGMLLRHSNIVRVYDARDIEDTFIMVMELVDGVSLRTLLGRAHDRNACMPVPAALHIAREVTKALQYAHAACDAFGRPLGIIHRDVSPHNILLGRDGFVKLTDFGLANANVHETVHKSYMIGGKLGYIAPEILRQKPLSHRVDLFALGVVIWEMLGGRRLFSGADDTETVRNILEKPIPALSNLNPNVPPALDTLISRILAQDPDQRIASAQELLLQLDSLVDKVDRNVSQRDIALMVGLHLASEPDIDPGPAAAVAELLEKKLDVFVRAAADAEADYDIGAMPLNPMEFGP